MTESTIEDYHWSAKAEDIDDILRNRCEVHSRQAEATIFQTLWPRSRDIIRFVRERVAITWKRKNHVALLHQLDSQGGYLIILDTKLENESMKARIGILSLKIAEAYLLENPLLGLKREELATQWGVDLSALDNESIWGLTY